LFKLVASIYLKSVLHSPAGATFGPVLGLMVFVYVSARLLLFATAWAATTATEESPKTRVEPPLPAVITSRVQVNDDLKVRQALTAAAVGAVGALGLSWLLRRSKH
jgi:membrane protein